jgi:hypothetical protein
LTARSIRSFALSCVSVSAKRKRTLFASSTVPVIWICADLSACSTRASSAASTLTVDLALEICTAGDSPKKFGSVYSSATRIAIAISVYFQTG